MLSLDVLAEKGADGIQFSLHEQGKKLGSNVLFILIRTKAAWSLHLSGGIKSWFKIQVFVSRVHLNSSFSLISETGVYLTSRVKSLIYPSNKFGWLKKKSA